MNRKHAEAIRSLSVTLAAGQKVLKQLPRGKLKGRGEPLRLIALEALDGVEKALEDCAEAYLEERFGIHYGTTVVIVNLHKPEGVVKHCVRVMKARFSGLGGDLSTEQGLDRLQIEAWVHAPGEDRHDEGIDFVFNGSLGDVMLANGEANGR